MRFPTKEQVETIKRCYPSGARLELIKMDDPQAPPAGTKGTVICVDDAGDILVNWDNGSSLNVVYGVDIVRRICPMCGGIMSEYPALSRRDNKTEICSDCGIREALADIGVDIDDQEKIVQTIHELSDDRK